MNKLSRGFTLFEILIVVVIIGILATVLVAAIDPLESIRKTNDTGMITVLTNVQNAFATYGANEGVMPWDDGSADGNCNQTATFGRVTDINGTHVTAGGNFDDQITGTGADKGCVAALVSGNYLKASILGALNTARRKRVFFTVIKDNINGDKVVLCFRPESRDIKKQMNWGLPDQSNISAFNQNAPSDSINGPKIAANTNGLWCSF